MAVRSFEDAGDGSLRPLHHCALSHRAFQEIVIDNIKSE